MIPLVVISSTTQEKCSLPITIPDYQSLDQDGEKFVVSVTFVLC